MVRFASISAGSLQFLFARFACCSLRFACYSLRFASLRLLLASLRFACYSLRFASLATRFASLATRFASLRLLLASLRLLLASLRLLLASLRLLSLARSSRLPQGSLASLSHDTSDGRVRVFFDSAWAMIMIWDEVGMKLGGISFKKFKNL